MKKRKRNKHTAFRRTMRAMFAIVILTAFVMGVSYFVKEVSALNTNRFASLLEPVSAKFGFDVEQTGEVAGEFIERFSQTGINKASDTETDETSAITDNSTGLEDKTANKVPVATIALLADSGDDFDSLEKAVNAVNELAVDYVFHLGDLTNWGDVESLTAAKETISKSAAPWYVLPGDHDLAQSVGLENFTQVFGANYHKLQVGNVTIMMLDNSANYTPMDEERYTWFLNNIESTDIVLLSQPLYSVGGLPSMGYVKGEELTDVLNQAKILLAKIRSSGVKAIIAADHHIPSTITDPEEPGLQHIVVGALADEDNENIILPPRFTLLHIYADNTYAVEEVKL